MPTTTTAHASWSLDNTTGSTGFKFRYRLSGTTVWSAVTTSGTTVDISGLAINRLYDFQIVNLNNAENPASGVYQSINITDPYPVFFPTNDSITIEFDNLSEDIDTYTATIATKSSPGVILHTEVITPADTMSYTFTDLLPVTAYVITLTPAANQFTNTFTYNVTTEAFATCPSVVDVTATLS